MLAVDDVVLKRTPSTEGVLYDVREVLGRTLSTAVAADEPIRLDATG